jgi:hypothetical protein
VPVAAILGMAASGCVNWRDLNHPAPTRFGIVANPTTQFAYLDHDHNWTRWPLVVTQRLHVPGHRWPPFVLCAGIVHPRHVRSGAAARLWGSTSAPHTAM